MYLQEVSDLYEASYLVLKGCTLEEVRCIPLSEGLSCLFIFTGENVEENLIELRSRKACVNLSLFRESYGRVTGYVHEAKKNYDRKRRLARKEGMPSLDGGII